MIQKVQATGMPSIITEFGQFCCPTNGACYNYNGTYDGEKMGYDEAIMTVAKKYNVSWTPWSWRPGGGNGHNCQDVNAD